MTTSVTTSLLEVVLNGLWKLGSQSSCQGAYSCQFLQENDDPSTPPCNSIVKATVFMSFTQVYLGFGAIVEPKSSFLLLWLLADCIQWHLLMRFPTFQGKSIWCFNGEEFCVLFSRGGEMIFPIIFTCISYFYFYFRCLKYDCQLIQAFPMKYRLVRISSLTLNGLKYKLYL